MGLGRPCPVWGGWQIRAARVCCYLALGSLAVVLAAWACGTVG